MQSSLKKDLLSIEKKEFSAGYRWQHWIRVVSIIALTITGFYIANPFLSPIPSAEPTNFMNALFRSWHLIFGFILIAMFIYKFYLFFFSKESKGERISAKDVVNVKTWKEQIGYYLLISKHPKLKGVYNPLQFASYFGFYLILFGIVLTGLVLYVHTFHDGLASFLYTPMRFVEVMLGGIANIRILHHIFMWGILLFIVVHVYMAIFNAVFGKKGAMDAIFSGLKWHKKEH